MTAKKAVSEVSKREGGLRNALVDEGRAVFEENGASELSLRALARRLGVSEAAPFKHFEGKEELLAAIASSGFDELARTRTEIAAKDLGDFERAEDMMRSYVQFARDHPGLFELMIGPRLHPYRSGELGESGARSYGLFAGAIHALARNHGWPEDALELLAHAAWSLEHGIATLIHARVIPREGTQLELDTIIEFSLRVFLRAVESGPAIAGSLLVPRKRGPRSAPLKTLPSSARSR